MSYISLSFLLFCVLFELLYFVAPLQAKKYVLLAANLVFYAVNSTWLTAAVFITSVSVFLLGKRLGVLNGAEKEQVKAAPKEERKAVKAVFKKKKDGVVLLACAVNIGLLLFFKYLGFFTGNVNGLLHLFGSSAQLPLIRLALPLGISYYTLMAVSYVVDVYRKRIEADGSYLRVLLYLTFFPAVVEGPISNYKQIADQLYEPHRFDRRQFSLGAQRILWGLFKKIVLADRLAILVNAVFDDDTAYGGLVIVGAAVGYTIQIYMEFSGCMDLVLGIAQTVGITLPENFRQPFFSGSIQEFWRRWHITLGAWIKEYVFYTVFLSRVGQRVGKLGKKRFKTEYFQSSFPMLFTLLFVWLCNGFWHGASWKYVLYGIYYYIIISIGILIEPLIVKTLQALHVRRDGAFAKTVSILRTDALVVFGLLLFRSPTVTQTLRMAAHAVTRLNVRQDIITLLDMGLTLVDFGILALGVAAVFAVSVFKERKKSVNEMVLDMNPMLRGLVLFVVLLFLVLFGIYGPSYTMQPFIYGQF